MHVHIPSKNWCNELEQLNDMSMICGGDWNLVLENIDEKEVPLVVT
jgi:hypothetical protein